MAQSVRNIISLINGALQGVFTGSTLYGVATIVEREGKSQPVVDERPVGFDDSYALQAYHRVNGATITYQPGYGDTDTTINTFACSVVVFNNSKITKLHTDEVAMIIQSVLAALNISSASVTPTGIILNSQQVFATEYKGVPYALDEYKTLMQMNYTVEITFKGNCFDLCPEDFSQCSGASQG